MQARIILKDNWDKSTIKITDLKFWSDLDIFYLGG